MQILETDKVGLHLQSEYRLNTLSLYLDYTSFEPDVVFDMTAPDADQNNSQIGLMKCSLTEIGMPLKLEDQSLTDEAFRLPDHIAKPFAGVASYLDTGNAPVWLRFAAPSGLLPIVPWERLLGPVCPRPVLRLPYHRFAPTAPRRRVDAALYVGSSAAVPLIHHWLEHVARHLAQKTVLHLFAEASEQQELADLRERLADEFDVHLHPPPPDDWRPKRISSASGVITNRSLIWIRDRLHDRTVDAVHFVAESFLVGEDSGLLLHDERREDAYTRYVRSPELVEFLSHVGAWSVAFTAPPGNRSMPGLRLLADQIARVRPGPCLVHDMRDASALDALGHAYRYLYSPDWPTPPSSPALSIYCHPYHGLEAGAVDAYSQEVLRRTTLVQKVGEEQLASESHAWLSSAQRVLEQCALNVTAGAVPEEEQSRMEGRLSALEFVADSLARHANDPLEAAAASKDDAAATAAQPPARGDKNA
jgi:hypothetical protein